VFGRARRLLRSRPRPVTLQPCHGTCCSLRSGRFHATASGVVSLSRPQTLRSTSTGYACRRVRRRLIDRMAAPFPCPAAEPCGSAPECRCSSATLHRTGTGSASHNGAHYATLILSGAHPHGLRSKMSGSRTRHTFWNYGHPSGFDRIAFCQLGGRARERGLSRGQRGRFTGGRSARAPAPAGRPPKRKAYHVKPSVCFQVFSRQTASRSRLKERGTF
jgi:hypothetical protein